jgi:hypothetical protein
MRTVIGADSGAICGIGIVAGELTAGERPVHGMPRLDFKVVLGSGPESGLCDAVRNGTGRSIWQENARYNAKKPALEERLF